MLVTLEVSQFEILPTDHDVAQQPANVNIYPIFVTFEVFQDDKSKLNSLP